MLDAMLTHHLVPQDAGQLGQGLQVGDVDDQGSQVVIEDETQCLQELIQLVVILIVRGNSKELCVQLVFILADMEQECSASPWITSCHHCHNATLSLPEQSSVVSGVDCDQLGHRSLHTVAQQLQSTVEIVCLDIRQEARVLRQ